MYAARRTYDSHGVTIPSQRLFVRYFGQLLTSGVPCCGVPHLRSVHIVGLGERLAKQATVVVYGRAPGQVASKPVAVVTARGCHGRRSSSVKAWSTLNAQGGVLEVDGRFATLTFSPPLQLHGDVKIQVCGVGLDCVYKDPHARTV